MISEIAEQVGIPDPAYFSRVFRGLTGKSPLEYVTELSANLGRQAK
jgi:YesN/AraC family two-component response regulator